MKKTSRLVSWKETTTTKEKKRVLHPSSMLHIGNGILSTYLDFTKIFAVPGCSVYVPLAVERNLDNQNLAKFRYLYVAQNTAVPGGILGQDILGAARLRGSSTRFEIDGINDSAMNLNVARAL